MTVHACKFMASDNVLWKKMPRTTSKARPTWYRSKTIYNYTWLLISWQMQKLSYIDLDNDIWSSTTKNMPDLNIISKKAWMTRHSLSPYWSSPDHSRYLAAAVVLVTRKCLLRLSNFSEFCQWELVLGLPCFGSCCMMAWCRRWNHSSQPRDQ